MPIYLFFKIYLFPEFTWISPVKPPNPPFKAKLGDSSL